MRAGVSADALAYEIADMEKTVRDGDGGMCLNLTKDVMDLMTAFRKDWGVVYPEEEPG